MTPAFSWEADELESAAALESDHPLPSRDRATACPERRREREMDWELEAGFSFANVPSAVLALLRAGREPESVRLAIRLGNRSENHLSDLVFFNRHPERHGAFISTQDPDYSQASREWLTIRNSLVRPALFAPTPHPPTNSPRNPASGGGALQVRSGVRLTDAIQRAVDGLRPHFERRGVQATVTSGLRTPEAQLQVIRGLAQTAGIMGAFPALASATVDDVESWLPAWDELLSRKGYVVNPPVSACSRITGKCYGPSPHSSGNAFDLSGTDLEAIAATVQDYCQTSGGIREILIETKNHAVHIGLGDSSTCTVERK